MFCNWPARLSDLSPWLTEWLVSLYLNCRSDFPMPHPETPYNHSPYAHAITIDQHQAKKRIRQARSYKFFTAAFKADVQIITPRLKSRSWYACEPTVQHAGIRWDCPFDGYSNRSATHPMFTFHYIGSSLFPTDKYWVQEWVSGGGDALVP